MVSPVLDEEHIKQLLKAPATADHINLLQAGAAGAAMDLFDRDVTRDEFALGLHKCIVLNAQCAKLFMLKQIEVVFKEGVLTQDAFAKAEHELTEIIRKQSEAVIDMVKRLQDCASDEDPIH